MRTHLEPMMKRAFSMPQKSDERFDALLRAMNLGEASRAEKAVAAQSASFQAGDADCGETPTARVTHCGRSAEHPLSLGQSG